MQTISLHPQRLMMAGSQLAVSACSMCSHWLFRLDWCACARAVCGDLSFNVHMHIHTYICTYVRTYEYFSNVQYCIVCMHTYVHMYICTECLNIYNMNLMSNTATSYPMGAWIHMYTVCSTYVRMYVCTYACAYVCTYIRYTSVCVCVCVCVCLHACIPVREWGM